MKILKQFHNAAFDTRFVFETKELQLLIRAEGNHGELRNFNLDADLSEKLFSISKHNGQLWNNFIKKFCEKAKLAKNDLTEVSLKTEQNREGRYSLLIKMGDRGFKVIQLLGDNLENAIDNYVEDRAYELKPLKEKMAPPPPSEESVAPAAESGVPQAEQSEASEGSGAPKAENSEKAEKSEETIKEPK